MLDQIIQDLEKRGWSHLAGVITPQELRVLNAFFLEHRGEFTPARVGAKHNRQRATEIRGDFTYWLDPLKPSDPFRSIMEFLDRLKERCNSSFYLGLQQYECHLAYYPPGTFYKKHSDRFEADSSRSLSFIFYLNESWEKSQGGELVLYDKADEVLAKIEPAPGSFMCFLSDEFPHEVLPATHERRSLTVWMHTRIIY